MPALQRKCVRGSAFARRACACNLLSVHASRPSCLSRPCVCAPVGCANWSLAQCLVLRSSLLSLLPAAVVGSLIAARSPALQP